MSTHGVIARPTPDGFEGRYHNWDSNPPWLGRDLFRLRNGHFAGDTDAMLKVLIDEHTAWSTIVDTDFNLPIGFLNPTQANIPQRNPRCYCHGDRYETGWLVGPATANGYVYVIDGATMLVYKDWEPYRGGELTDGTLIGTVDLDGAEPDWEAIA